MHAEHERAGMWRWGWVLALVWLSAFPYFELTRNANERPRLVQGMALAETATLVIDGPARRGLDLGPDTARTRDGRLVPNKPPGTAPLAAAGYWAASAEAGVRGQPLTLRGLTFWARVFGGLIPWLVLAAALSTSARPQARTLVSSTDDGARARQLAMISVLIGTPLFAYGRLLYGHVVVACLLAWGIRQLARGMCEGDAGRAAGGGLLLGLAWCVDYLAVVASLPVAVVAIAVATKKGRIGPLFAAAIGGALGAAPLLAYHDVSFGSPWLTGYHHVTDVNFARAHAQGLLGLGLPNAEGTWTHLLSPTTGVVGWAPVTLAGIVGLWFGVRDSALSAGTRPAGDEILDSEGEGTEAAMHLLSLVTLLIVVAGLTFSGGWRVGPRYLVIVMPAIAVGGARLLARGRRLPWAHPLWAFVLGAGLLANVLAATLWPHIDFTFVIAPIRDLLWPLLRAGAAPHGPLSAAGIGGGGAFAVVLALSVVVTALLWGTVSERRPFVMGALAVGIALSLAAEQTRPPHPRAEDNLRYVLRVYEPEIGAPSVPAFTRPLLRANERERAGAPSR